MKDKTKSLTTRFAALALAALGAISVHAGGFDGKPLTTNDWFDVSFTGVAADTAITNGATTGFTLGAGSWTAPSDGEAVVLADNTLSFDADDNDLLTLTPAALANTVSNETVAVEVNAGAVTTELETPSDSPITAFSLYDNGTTVTPVAYVAGGWTNLVYANADSLTNAWFMLYIDFSNDNGTKLVRFSVKPNNGSLTVLPDSDGETWFPIANSATNISSISFSGTGLCRKISGDSLGFAVAEVNGTRYESFAAAIAAADAAGVSTITILDGTAVSPDADWKVANGQLVKKVYVAQIGTTKYETLAEAFTAANTTAGSETITIMILQASVSSGAATITHNLLIDTELAGGATINFNSNSFTAQSGAVVTFSDAVTAAGNVDLNVVGGSPVVENAKLVLNNTVAASGMTVDVNGGEIVINPTARVTLGGSESPIYLAVGNITVNGSLNEGEAQTVTLAEVAGEQQLSGTGGYFKGFFGKNIVTLNNTFVSTVWVDYSGYTDYSSYTQYGPAYAGYATDNRFILTNSVLYITDVENQSNGFNLGGFNGVLSLTGSRLISNGSPVVFNAGDVANLDVTSSITAKTFTNNGVINIDATGIDAPVKVIDYIGSGAKTLADYGTVNVTAGEAYVEDNDLWVKKLPVAQIGSTKYETLAAAIAAAVDGDTIELLSNVVWDGTGAYCQLNVTGSVTIDGKGYTLSAPTTGGPTDSAILLGDTGWSTAQYTYMVTNMTFSGFTTISHSVLRVQGVRATIVDCTFTGNGSTGGEWGVVTANNGANVTVKDCVFSGNTGTKCVDVGFNVATGSSLAVDNCLFENNNLTGHGVIYVAGDITAASVTNSTFSGNTVLSPEPTPDDAKPNAAVVYCSGVTSITGCLFTNNTVKAYGKEGVVVLGSGAQGAAVTGNAFVDNELSTDRSPAHYATLYVSKTCNLSANYWGDGAAPAEEDQQDIYNSGTQTPTIDTYATNYTVVGNGVTVMLYVPPVAQIDGVTYTTLAAAIDAAEEYKAEHDEYPTITVLDADAAAAELDAASDWKISGDELVRKNVIATLAQGGAIVGKYEDLHDALEAGKAAGSVVTLLQDVDLAGVNWVPVGTSSSKFQGVFDGNGKTISNFTINRPEEDYVAMFGYGDRGVDSTVKNVTFENVTITGRQYVGTVCAYDMRVVSNVTVRGSIAISGNYYTGGLCGFGYTYYYDDAVIGSEGSYVRAVYLNSSIEGDGAGGLVGHNGSGTTLGFYNCEASGLTVSGTRKVGGLVGTIDLQNQIVDVNVHDITVVTTATAEYANSNKSTMEIGGVVGGYHGDGGNNLGTISGVVRDITIPVADFQEGVSAANGNVNYGLVAGGARGSDPGIKGAVDYSGLTAVGYDPAKYSNSYLLPKVAQIGDVKYASFEEAIADVQDGETIVVLGYDSETMVAPTGWEFSIDTSVEPPVTTLVRSAVYVAQIGETKYETLQAAIADAVNGDTIELLMDIQLFGTEQVAINKVGNFVIDGKGYAISPAADSAYIYERFKFGMDGEESNFTKNYTVTNLTITGFTDSTYFIRNEGCSVTFVDCTITNNNLSAQSNSRLVLATASNLTMKDCVVADNATASYLVDFNTNGSANGTVGTLDVDGCLFDGNTVGGTGLVYTYGSSSGGDAIKNSTFSGNTVNSAAAAIVYFSGATDVTGCFFTNNTVTASDATQKCGVLALGSGAAGSDYTGNAFVNNELTAAAGGAYGTIYAGAKNVDLTANYWGSGNAPTTGNGADLYLAKDEGVVYDSFAYSYALNDDNYGVTVVLGKMVTFEGEAPTGATGDFSLPASTAYAVGSALPLPTYTATDASFAGWQVKNSDPVVVVSTLPADIASPVTLVATWTVVKSVQVTEGVSKPQTIKVTEEWLEKKGLEEANDTAIQAALDTPEANGLPAWQNYVLGQDPGAAVAADAAQGSVEAMPVVSTVQPQNVDTGFKVEYRLDEVNADGSPKAGGAGEPQDTPVLPVDLTELTSENNVAYYKTVAVITSETDSSVTITVESTNTIGVLRVDSTAKTSAIAVPWDSLEGGTKGISVSNLVRTATLTPGDELKAYYSDGKNYKAWVLDEHKNWEPTTVVGGAAESPADEYTIPRGSAVWLTRQDTTQPIYLVGAATEGKAKVSLETGTSENPSWNLVGSTSSEPVSIDALIPNPGDGDKVSVPTAYIPKEYEYVEGKGWGYWDSVTTEPDAKGRVFVKRVFRTDDTTIPAGTGFWYISSGSTETINL